MDMIADILLISGALGVAFYCFVLSRRLTRFTDLEQGVGGAVAVLSAQVDDLQKALDRAREASETSGVRLQTLTAQADAVAHRLELHVAALHDLPQAPPPPAPAPPPQQAAPTPMAPPEPTPPAPRPAEDDFSTLFAQPAQSSYWPSRDWFAQESAASAQAEPPRPAPQKPEPEPARKATPTGAVPVPSFFSRRNHVPEAAE
ncbi:hypothetical protein LX81_02676 [Palleronia aestuarii]|uniref:Uncharacterized protein n=1 Tax=Palleronia aestuarii TaxID=568105 RepID=A0A2W7NAI1_9RHOB|nr:hypothetical protein [Palleronia aestuarii]PZX15087.1 hypothetical protein LX81_02676 [Palleronia aestuarii]